MGAESPVLTSRVCIGLGVVKVGLSDNQLFLFQFLLPAFQRFGVRRWAITCGDGFDRPLLVWNDGSRSAGMSAAVKGGAILDQGSGVSVDRGSS
jgi:hypothetical protein